MLVPKRYLPKSLTRKDKKFQQSLLRKSRKLYKKGIYFSRKNLKSFKTKKSDHVIKAEKMYKVKSVKPSPRLAKVTGCSLSSLKKIVNKGRGAYFSSGSRPNQSAESWGLARLASSITGGKASAVDFKILERGCKHSGKAYKKAVSSPYFKKGTRRVKHAII